MLSSLSKEVRASFLERHALLREHAAAMGEELPAVTAEGVLPEVEQQQAGMPNPNAGSPPAEESSAVGTHPTTSRPAAFA